MTEQLISKYNRPVPRYTSFPTIPEWNQTFVDWEKHISIQGQQDEAISLYLHLPYCRKRCWYCGCNSLIRTSSDGIEPYLDLIIDEAKMIAQASESKLRIKQLHLGGGTPNFLNNEQMTQLIKTLEKIFDFSPCVERAIEIDPRLSNNEQLNQLKTLGFDRLSLGIQDFNPEVQVAINREQSYESIRDLTFHARSIGFSSINFDLIYGLPKQTIDGFMETIRLVDLLKPDRIALYSFAHLPDKIKHMKLIKEEDLPEGQLKLSLYQEAQKALLQNGYQSIAMDHFALETDSLNTALKENKLNRTFMGYTSSQENHYLGLGVSSISYINGCFWQNDALLPTYTKAIQEKQLAIKVAHDLNEDELIRQELITKIMCNFSLDKNTFAQNHLIDFDQYFSKETQLLQEFIDDGLVSNDSNHLKITAEGEAFMRPIVACFDPYYQNKKGVKQFSKAI